MATEAEPTPMEADAAPAAAEPAEDAAALAGDVDAAPAAGSSAKDAAAPAEDAQEVVVDIPTEQVQVVSNPPAATSDASIKHKSMLQKSMKKLNVTKTLHNLGLLRLDRQSSGEGDFVESSGEGDFVDAAKARVRRLSLSSSVVEKYNTDAKSAVRASIASSGGLSKSSLARTAGVAASTNEGSFILEEPTITCKEDLKAWIAWAKQEAEVNNHLLHPRIKLVPGAPKMKAKPPKDVDVAKEKSRRRGEEALSRETSKEASRRLKGLIPMQLPLNASSHEMMEVFGVGVRLYFDFMKLFMCIAALGVLCSIPSYIASLGNVHRGAYASDHRWPKLGVPGFTALMSLGARTAERDLAYGGHEGCNTTSCKTLNTWAAVLDVLYVIFVFMLVNEFRKYAITLSKIDGEVNVRVEDYTAEIFGFAGLNQTEPAEVRNHMEKSLIEHAKAKMDHYKKLKEYHQAKLQDEGTWWRRYHKARVNVNQAHQTKWRLFLDENCQQVADVTMIVHDRGLLRKLVKLVPFEKAVSTLKKQKEIAEATEAGGCTKYIINSKLVVAERKLDYKRMQVDATAAKDLNPMGAFVTFQRARAKEVTMDLFRPRGASLWGKLFGCCCDPQPVYARFDEKASGGDEVSNKRLSAYKAPRPQNVRYENLATKFAVTTKLRRCCSYTLLVVILILSVVIAILAVAVKLNAKKFATLLLTQTDLVSQSGGTNSAGNATAVANALACTAEQDALILSFGSQLTSDLVGTVNSLMEEVSGSVTSKAGLELLVALLSCKMVPLLQGLVTLVIVILNLSVTTTVHGLVEFCRYDSLTAQHAAIVINLAIVQFLNTGVTSFLVNMATGPDSLVPQSAPIPDICWHPFRSRYYTQSSDEGFGISCLFGEHGIFLKGEHFSLGPKWYQDVGASLVLTLIITLGIRGAGQCIASILYMFKKACTTGSVRHVEIMKAIYLGPIPRLAFLLGKYIAYAALCVSFSTLLPLLHILLLIYTVVYYCLDKWYLLRICRTPTPYSASFIYSTLWWVQWALLIKLILGFWAFGSMPGFGLSDTIRAGGSAVQGTGAVVDRAANFIDLFGDAYTFIPIKTVSSVLYLVGIVLLVIMMSFTYVKDAAGEWFTRFMISLRVGDQDEDHLWPPEKPTFADVIRGAGVSSSVRVLKQSNVDTGQREVLALQSDIDDRCCAGCINPVQILMWLFGIETSRPKIKTQEAFDKLEPKNNAIIGAENMSYAPHFMPNYREAFAFAEKEGHGQAAKRMDARAGRGASVLNAEVPKTAPKMEEVEVEEVAVSAV